MFIHLYNIYKYFTYFQCTVTLVLESSQKEYQRNSRVPEIANSEQVFS